MKTVLFTYESPIGTFWLRPEPAGRVQLGLDRRKLQTYSSPKEAARAVAERRTGEERWDEATEMVAPAGLHKWKAPVRARKASKAGVAASEE